jgi:hypothetical protein
LSCKTDRDPRHSCRTENGAKIEGDDDHEGDSEVANELAQDHDRATCAPEEIGIDEVGKS